MNHSNVAPDGSQPDGRRASLDGLRAIAVVAVCVYHADATLLPGGFIGVDLFFVLSGYLITTLLVGEHDRRGRVSVRDFWIRRIRRLWPLAWLTLAVVAAASVTGVWSADRQRSLPTELLAALGNVANWYQIGHGGYVAATTAPSPVRHFWSLAIEEQYYLVWPAVLAALLTLPAARRRIAVPAMLAAAGGASLAAGFVVADQPDRAYLGTDVRLIALAVGAALAWAWRAHPLRSPASQTGRTLSFAAGVTGLVAFAAATLTLHADSELLPHGGFALVAVVSAAIIAGALSPTMLSTVLGWAPLAWLGRVSFALYLVHWPLLVALGPGRSTWLRLAVAGPASLLLAAGLHSWVERPMIRRRVSARAVLGATVVLASVSVAALVIAVPEGRTAAEEVEASLRRTADPGPKPTADDTAGNTVDDTRAAATTTVPCRPATSVAPASDAPAEVTVADPTVASCAGQIDVLVVGDSTGRGAANGLVALADPRVVVWDRTLLGCSYGGERCADWREAWPLDVAAIDPDVVVLFSGVVSDLHGVEDEPFLSDVEAAARATQFDDSIRMLGAQGAKVIVVLPTAPLPPKGLFFCDGRGRDSNCDPAWVDRWNDDMRAAALRTNATPVDAGAWIEARNGGLDDRPDGVHLSIGALKEQAAWLVPQIVTLAGS